MDKKTRISYIIILLVFIILPAPAYLFNRQAAKDSLAAASGTADYFVFHESLKSDVLIGKDGWLFYTGQQFDEEDPIGDWLGTNQFTDEELERITVNFCAARDVMEERGGEFLLVLSPAKMSVYPELMPARFGQRAEYTRLTQLEQYLRENTDLRIVCPLGELLAHKEEHPEQNIFLKYDTHESYVGGYLSTDAILRELGMEPLPKLESLTWQPNETEKADLARLLGLSGVFTDDFNAWNTAFHRHYINEWYNEDETEQRFVNENGDGDPRKLMMITDSFGAQMFIYLSDYFNESYLIYPYRYEPGMLEAEAPDILIYQVTERFLRVPLSFSLE